MKKLTLCSAAFVILLMNIKAQQLLPTEKEEMPVVSRISDDSYSGVIPISKMDQRKIYNWANGQKATPTGRKAGDKNAVYAKVSGNFARVIYDPPASAAVSNYTQGRRTPAGFNSNYSLVHIMKLDQRRIYNWGNGQSSTPTGRMAGESNIDYVKVYGNFAVVVK